MPFPKKKVIYGCEGRGDGDRPYLTRWTLLVTPWGRLYLHLFHRSDADDLHDHPWAFASLILWCGYIEETPQGRRRKWPGMVLFRPATWVHRVELVGGKPALSLVWVCGYVREWGFFTSEGRIHWRDYFKKMGC